MKQKGKYGKLWDATRRKWISENPPNHQGYYVCWICGVWVASNAFELDHVESRSRHPERRFDLTNLRPSCHSCNAEKGSGEVEQEQFISNDFDDTDLYW